MKCRKCGKETEHEEETLCRKCFAEEMGEEIEKHPIVNVKDREPLPLTCPECGDIWMEGWGCRNPQCPTNQKDYYWNRPRKKAKL